MDSLLHLIKGLYGGEVADNEAILAENNLLGFFRKLEAIEERLSQEIKNTVSIETCNKLNNENIRS